MKTIAIISSEGGVGKTAITHFLGYKLLGNDPILTDTKVMVADLDLDSPRHTIKYKAYEQQAATNLKGQTQSNFISSLESIVHGSLNSYLSDNYQQELDFIKNFCKNANNFWKSSWCYSNNTGKFTAMPNLREKGYCIIPSNFLKNKSHITDLHKFHEKLYHLKKFVEQITKTDYFLIDCKNGNNDTINPILDISDIVIIVLRVSFNALDALNRFINTDNINEYIHDKEIIIAEVDQNAQREKVKLDGANYIYNKLGERFSDNNIKVFSFPFLKKLGAGLSPFSNEKNSYTEQVANLAAHIKAL